MTKNMISLSRRVRRSVLVLDCDICRILPRRMSQVKTFVTVPAVFRLDRFEPSRNEATPGHQRDTTTPSGSQADTRGGVLDEYGSRPSPAR